MISTAEVAMLIKLGGDIDIAEYGLSVSDMVPYINCNTTDIASSNNTTFSVSRISESITFRIREAYYNKGDIIHSESTLNG